MLLFYFFLYFSFRSKTMQITWNILYFYNIFIYFSFLYFSLKKIKSMKNYIKNLLLGNERKKWFFCGFIFNDLKSDTSMNVMRWGDKQSLLHFLISGVIFQLSWIPFSRNLHYFTLHYDLSFTFLLLLQRLLNN